ncbi:RNA polymerase sigma-70 factor [Membranicola marinus]|uniref:RNA polymerase sigma-70 factor n=1 Tax=Membranihabitans marinus TaxID=1227546 RepID=A0A953LE24_9BACT|nr:RNA polymerase sigma-70 factor [Membranihabitans marinus]MBY5959504.1 RNA polymerase sigma-70 factor [Membranihabitans marinus]
MAIEKEFSKNTASLKKRSLAIDSEDTSGDRSGLVKSRDREYFLRKAFREDPWEGCTLIFKHYYSPLCSHAIRYVYSQAYAEDIVSEVFMEFWQKKHFEKIHTTYRTYLFQAVRNRALNFVRKEFGRELDPITEGELLGKSLSPEQIMVHEEFYQKVQEGIEQLPPKCKKVFLMSRNEGKPIKEIAAQQKISVRTVETHISKALKMMREVLVQTNH